MADGGIATAGRSQRRHPHGDADLAGHTLRPAKTPVGRWVERRNMRASATTADTVRYVPRLKHFDTETRVMTFWPATTHRRMTATCGN